MHKVSLMTARHALADLAREGHGGATPRFRHVRRAAKNSFQQIDELHGADGQQGIGGQVENYFFELCAITSTKSRRGFRCHPNSHLFMLERVRQAGDEPFALETCYLSADEFPALAGGALERGSLFVTLEREYGVELAYADEEIDATAADLKNRGTAGRAARLSAAAHSPADFHHEGKSLHVRAGPVPLGPPHLGDSQISLIVLAM